MTFDPARPRYTLPFAGQEYELLGTLEVIEAVEHAMQDGIVQVATRVVDMGVTDTARVLAAVLTACGHKTASRDIARTIFDTLGINSEAFQMLRLHLYAFLKIIMQPPEARERAAQQMGEMLGKATLSPPSRGGSTKKSV